MLQESDHYVSFASRLPAASFWIARRCPCEFRNISFSQKFEAIHNGCLGFIPNGLMPRRKTQRRLLHAKGNSPRRSAVIKTQARAPGQESLQPKEWRERRGSQASDGPTPRIASSSESVRPSRISVGASGLVGIKSLGRVCLFDARNGVVRIHTATPHMCVAAVAAQGPTAGPFPIRDVILTLHSCDGWRRRSRATRGTGRNWRPRPAGRFEPGCRRHMAHRRATAQNHASEDRKSKT